jgi:hypothetical protein
MGRVWVDPFFDDSKISNPYPYFTPGSGGLIGPGPILPGLLLRPLGRGIQETKNQPTRLGTQIAIQTNQPSSQNKYATGKEGQSEKEGQLGRVNSVLFLCKTQPQFSFLYSVYPSLLCRYHNPRQARLQIRFHHRCIYIYIYIYTNLHVGSVFVFWF